MTADGISHGDIWQDYDIDGRFDIHMITTGGEGSTTVAYIDDGWVPGTLNMNQNTFSETDGTTYRFVDGEGWVRQ